MISESGTGNVYIDTAVEQLIQHITSHLPNLQLGFYLHGSWAANGARLGSDIDILALSLQPFSDDQWQKAEQLAQKIATATGVSLDFHLIELDMLIADPWVDLRRTGRFLYGTDVRTRFPEPTLDSLARESVLIACLSAIDIRGGEYLHWPFDHPKPDDFSLVVSVMAGFVDSQNRLPG